jgi:hypothetical protein
MSKDETAERIADLERALKHEREVSAAERRRADLLEESARRAYRYASGMYAHRTEASTDSKTE